MGIKHSVTKSRGERGYAEEWNADHVVDSDVDFSGYKITNLADPTDNQDAATKSYVDSQSGMQQHGNEWHVPDFVDVTTDQTIDGVKTFTSFPVLPSSSPTNSYQAVHKALKQLERNKVVEVKQRKYSLNLNWVKKMEDFSKQIRNNYSKGVKNISTGEIANFTFSTIHETERFLVDYGTYHVYNRGNNKENRKTLPTIITGRVDSIFRKEAIQPLVKIKIMNIIIPRKNILFNNPRNR